MNVSSGFIFTNSPAAIISDGLVSWDSILTNSPVAKISD